MKHFLFYLLLLFVSVSEIKAEVDPNFYIFLCFGQSNMEGAAMPEPVDEENIDERFQMLACDNFASLGREMGKWYTAYPPIVREGKGIGMADYFGRTMVANLPDNIKVGVVDVAVGGVSILAFMPESAADWAWIMNGTYDNDPYTRLVLMARIAQQSGVIKGILMHQGEADYVRETEDWPQLVNTVYENLLTDLGLNAADVPLLVGEMIGASEGGQCAGHNDVIATVPSVIPTAHVISSAGCEAQSDGMHFALPGYWLMGERYALEMLNLLGAPEIMRGDANGNRVIDMDDVLEIRNAIMGYPSDQYNIEAADVNEDGHVNIADIVMLLKLHIIK